MSSEKIQPGTGVGAAGIPYRRLQRDGFTVCLTDQAENAPLLAALLPDPERLLAAGEVFKPGSRSHAVRVEIGQRSYFLKRYNCRGPLYSLRNAVRPSRAWRTWETTLTFQARQVPVPRPLVLLEKRRFRLLGRSYILMDFVAESERLRSLWPQLGEEARKTLLETLGAALGRMHRAGCLHGDLKWDNILVASDGGSGFQLVDLDGSRVLKSFRRASAEKDLARFLQDLMRFNQGQGEEYVLKAWRQAVDEG